MGSVRHNLSIFIMSFLSDVLAWERRADKSLPQLYCSCIDFQANLNTQGSDLCMVSVSDLNFLSVGVCLNPAKSNLVMCQHNIWQNSS